MGTSFPRNHWALFENVQSALRPIVDELGRMPTQRELAARKLSSLASAIHHWHGGLPAIQDKLGVTGVCRQRPTGHWKNLDAIRSAVLPVATELGRMPTRDELYERGLSSAANAIYVHHGGYEEVERALNLPAVQRPKPPGYWNDFSNLADALRPVIAELGRMPTTNEIHDRKLTVVLRACARNGGLEAVQRRLEASMPELFRETRRRKKRGHWQEFESVETSIAPVISELGRMPKSRELQSRKLSRLAAAIVDYHGGFPAVAARLGLAPIDDAAIAVRADKLVPAVLALGISDTAPLWAAAKKRWATRTLDAALATFATDGSLEAFRKLLADP